MKAQKYIQRFTLCLIISGGFLMSCKHDTREAGAGEGKDSLATKTEKHPHGLPLWEINQQASKVEFNITNFGAKVNGSLGGLQGKIYFDEQNLKNSSFDASVNVHTINTGKGKRDKDLMHEKYFNAEKYPEITFHSDTIIQSGKSFVTKGNLSMKGKPMKQQIPFTFEQKGDTGIFKSNFTLERLLYGIGGKGPIMGKEVNVSLLVVVNKK